MPMQGNACAGSSQPAQSPSLSACVAQAAHCLLGPQGPFIQEINLLRKPLISHITLTGSRLPINAPYSTFVLSSTAKLLIVFHPLADELSHTEDDGKLSITALTLGTLPCCGKLPGLSEVVKLPARSLVPPAKRGDTAASRGGPGAPGRLLLPRTRWPTRLTPLS